MNGSVEKRHVTAKKIAFNLTGSGAYGLRHFISIRHSMASSGVKIGGLSEKGRSDTAYFSVPERPFEDLKPFPSRRDFDMFLSPRGIFSVLSPRLSLSNHATLVRTSERCITSMPELLQSQSEVSASD
jgi:hypothetical protein